MANARFLEGFGASPGEESHGSPGREWPREHGLGTEGGGGGSGRGHGGGSADGGHCVALVFFSGEMEMIECPRTKSNLPRSENNKIIKYIPLI